MTTASCTLATALWGARFAGVWLTSCYTTWGDTTDQLIQLSQIASSQSPLVFNRLSTLISTTKTLFCNLSIQMLCSVFPEVRFVLNPPMLCDVAALRHIVREMIHILLYSFIRLQRLDENLSLRSVPRVHFVKLVAQQLFIANEVGT